MITGISKSDRKQIEEILTRRANEIAGFSAEYTKDGKHFGSVELALTREIERLRRLATNINPDEEGEE